MKIESPDDRTTDAEGIEITTYGHPRPQIDHEVLEDFVGWGLVTRGPEAGPAADVYEISMFRYNAAIDKSTWVVANGPWAGYEIRMPGHVPASR